MSIDVMRLPVEVEPLSDQATPGQIFVTFQPPVSRLSAARPAGATAITPGLARLMKAG
jgi:hypothetical protein